MEIYLVGGAVRDELLGLPIRERDFVVVGSTEKAMLAEGYRSVGKDFPVFLHPETQEEYALARTERKSGPGHQGFVCHADPDVTLEEDLSRRDLTINAIAREEDGTLIDPFGGENDLRNRILRHVTEAFREDPLRILRVARFLAYLSEFGFTIASETRALLMEMVNEGQLNELTPERVLMEVNKALSTSQPDLFFSFLSEIGADSYLWPELTPSAIQRLGQIESSDPDTRFAALVMDLGAEEISNVCQRLKSTNQRRDLSLLIASQLERWSTLTEMNGKAIVDFLYEVDALRKDERFNKFCEAADAILGSNLATHWKKMLTLTLEVRARDVAKGLKGPEVGDAVRQAQIEKLEVYRNAE